MQSRKQKVDDNSIIEQANDFPVGIHNLVSWVSNLKSYQNNFQDQSNVLCNLLLE